MYFDEHVGRSLVLITCRQRRRKVSVLTRAALTASVLSYGSVSAAASDPAGVVELNAIEVVGEGSGAGRIEPLKRGRVSTAAESLPASVSTITDEDIRMLNVDRDISNIYRRVPGVVASNIDQGDTGNGFRMRGFATNGTHGADVAVHVDGVPQNIPSSQGGAGHGPVFMEWLTPQMIKRVNVIKGPVSALYGDQNRAGSVDIQTLDGGDVASSIGLDIASFNGRRGNLVLGGEHEGLESLFVADIYKTDGYRKAAETNRDNYFWKLSTVIGDAKYSARFSHYDSDFKNDGYLNLPALKAGQISRRDTDDLAGFGNANGNTYVILLQCSTSRMSLVTPKRATLRLTPSPRGHHSTSLRWDRSVAWAGAFRRKWQNRMFHAAVSHASNQPTSTRLETL